MEESCHRTFELHTSISLIGVEESLAGPSETIDTSSDSMRGAGNIFGMQRIFGTGKQKCPSSANGGE